MLNICNKILLKAISIFLACLFIPQTLLAASITQTTLRIIPDLSKTGIYIEDSIPTIIPFLGSEGSPLVPIPIDIDMQEFEDKGPPEDLHFFEIPDQIECLEKKLKKIAKESQEDDSISRKEREHRINDELYNDRIFMSGGAKVQIDQNFGENAEYPETFLIPKRKVEVPKGIVKELPGESPGVGGGGESDSDSQEDRSDGEPSEEASDSSSDSVSNPSDSNSSSETSNERGCCLWNAAKYVIRFLSDRCLCTRFSKCIRQTCPCLQYNFDPEMDDFVDKAKIVLNQDRNTATIQEAIDVLDSATNLVDVMPNTTHSLDNISSLLATVYRIIIDLENIIRLGRRNTHELDNIQTEHLISKVEVFSLKVIEKLMGIFPDFKSKLSLCLHSVYDEDLIKAFLEPAFTINSLLLGYLSYETLMILRNLLSTMQPYVPHKTTWDGKVLPEFYHNIYFEEILETNKRKGACLVLRNLRKLREAKNAIQKNIDTLRKAREHIGNIEARQIEHFDDILATVVKTLKDLTKLEAKTYRNYLYSNYSSEIKLFVNNFVRSYIDKTEELFLNYYSERTPPFGSLDALKTHFELVSGIIEEPFLKLYDQETLNIILTVLEKSPQHYFPNPNSMTIYLLKFQRYLSDPYTKTQTEVIAAAITLTGERSLANLETKLEEGVKDMLQSCPYVEDEGEDGE